MSVTRSQVTAKAREYIGTPFQHQGRLKGRALDCVGLPLCVLDELGIIDTTGVPFKKTDNANYSSQPQDEFVHQEAIRRMISIPFEELQDGDMVTLRVPSIPCHVAIICTTCGVRGMIHAYTGNGKCVEHVMDKKWRRRIAGCFRFPGVIDG
jgi:NlpC/P60 family putative phage cell wall peptidase